MQYVITIACSLSLASYKAGQSGLFYAVGSYDNTSTTTVNVKAFSYPGDVQVNGSSAATMPAYFGAAFAKPGSELTFTLSPTL